MSGTCYLHPSRQLWLTASAVTLIGKDIEHRLDGVLASLTCIGGKCETLHVEKRWVDQQEGADGEERAGGAERRGAGGIAQGGDRPEGPESSRREIF